MKKLNTYRYISLTAAAILIGSLALPVRAQNFSTQILDQGPIDYWPLYETNASSPPVDTVSNLGSAGIAATGYLLGGAIRGETRGAVNNYVMFTNNGQNIAYCYTRLDIPNLAALNPQPPFTIEFWAKVNSPFNPTGDGTPPTGVAAIASLSPFPNLTSRSGYVFYALPGSWTMRIGGEASYTATAVWGGAVDGTSWQHIVGEFDGTYLTIYVNGVEGGVTNTPGANLASSSAPFHPNTYVPTRIGGTDLTGGEYTDGNGNDVYPDGNRGFDGGIDEVAIYNALLSSNTIKAHYNMALTNPAGYEALVLTSAPVGYWNFDEPVYTPPSSNTYTFATDLGSLMDFGTNTLGTLVGQPGVPGLSSSNHSVTFNGAIGSFVPATTTNLPGQYFGYPGSPGPGIGSQITLAAWIKPVSFGFVSDIIAQGWDSETYSENFLRVGDVYDWEAYSEDDSYGDYNPAVLPDTIYYQVGTYDGFQNVGDSVIGSYGYNDAAWPAPAGDLGNWVFLVGTYDGTNWNLYRNGVLVNTFSDDANESVAPYGPSEAPELYPGEGPSGINDPWSVGSKTYPNEYSGMYFDGSIEDATILTNALDATTIMALYNSVHLPPVITQAPIAPSVSYLGSSVAFNVWADGPGTLTYQWYSNNIIVPSAITTNFAITNLTASSDGTYKVIVNNSYGSVTSSVVLFVTPTLPPVTLAPATEARWSGFPLSFAPVSLPNQSLSFQWYLNGTALGGATSSTYSNIASPATIGTYTLVLTNSLGASTSTPAIFTAALTHPAGYASTILADDPLSYFRLDETNGTTAYDYADGNNGTYYDVDLGQPGYSLIDSDLAVTFLGVENSYCGEIGPTNISFSGTGANFTIEAWANGGASQINDAAVVVKGSGNNGTSSTEQFAIGVDGAAYRFYVTDTKNNTYEAEGTAGPDGNWHHLVGVYSSSASTMTLYFDGEVAASTATPTLGVLTSTDPVSIGAERSGPTPVYDWDYSGTIDEVAIYPYALTSSQVTAHYAAAYGTTLPPFIKTQPISVTNYYNLPATLSVSAAGSVPLTYQWNKVGSGPVSGETANVFTIENLAYTDAGTYTVGITNTINGTNAGVLSIPVTLTVLPPPSNTLTIPGLVMHLTFDNNLTDVTGRGNNATNEASGTATLQTNDYMAGVIGQAFYYYTTTNTTSTNANYASIGYRPDLQFGTNSFTVSMWVLLPGNYVGNDLPFFCDVTNSTFGHPGFCFEPSYGTTQGTTLGWPGGWGFSVYNTSDVGVGVYGDVGTINDGQWHHLVYCIDKTSGQRVYLDGALAHENVQEGSSTRGLGDTDTGAPASIGQDPTGVYGQPSDGTVAIDDLGVWDRALTPMEAASIYEAGFYNQLTYTTVPLSFTSSFGAGHSFVLSWNEGELQSAPTVTGPWTAVSPASGSPYTIDTTAATAMFFRVVF
jgi:hypothetical protein